MKKSVKLPPLWMSTYLDRSHIGWARSPGISVFFPGHGVAVDFMPPRILADGSLSEWQIDEPFRKGLVRSRDSIEAYSTKYGDVLLRAHRERLDVNGKIYDVVTSIDISGDSIGDAAVLDRTLGWTFVHDAPSFGEDRGLPFTKDVCEYLEVKLLERHLQDSAAVYAAMCKRHWADALKLFKQFEQAGQSRINCSQQYYGVNKDCRKLFIPVFAEIKALYAAYRDPGKTLRAVLSAQSRAAKHAKK